MPRVHCIAENFFPSVIVVCMCLRVEYRPRMRLRSNNPIGEVLFSYVFKSILLKKFADGYGEMPKCAITTCPSRVGRNSPSYSYLFPNQDKSPERYASWCKHAVRRYVTKSSKVCAIHFKLDDFDESDIMKIRLTPGLFKNKTPKLKKGVVPSMYMDNNGYEDGCKDGAMLLPYVQIRDVQDILDGVPSSVCVQDDLEDSQPSTSLLYPDCEMSADEEKYSETEVAIQCEFGVEVYREFNARREAVDK